MGWDAEVLAGGNLSHCPALFDDAGKLLFKSMGSVINVYGSQTGEVLHRMTGHTNVITSLSLHPFNRLQILSSSLDGTVRVWDYEDGVCLKVLRQQGEVLALRTIQGKSGVAYIVTQLPRTRATPVANSLPNGTPSKSHKRKRPRNAMEDSVSEGNMAKQNQASRQQDSNSTQQRWRVSIVSLKSGVVLQTLFKLTSPPEAFAVRGCVGGTPAAAAGTEIVATVSGKKLWVWRGGEDAGAESKQSYRKEEEKREKKKKRKADKRVMKLGHIRGLTSVSIHPEQNVIATGDEVGQIVLWYIGESGGSAPVTSTLHWHAHAVTCVSFSSDGNYLLSGGEEAVLVLWQLGKAGNKTFLPRLRAPLTSVVADALDQTWAVTCSDNSMHVIGALDMKEKWRIRGISLAGSADRLRVGTKTGLVVDPMTGAVVLNGGLGSVRGGKFGVGGGAELQFYDVAKDTSVRDLEVAPRNYVSRTNEEVIPVPKVEQCCFSPDGADLVTLDRRGDTESMNSANLRFWRLNTSSGTYEMNSKIENPHQAQVSSLIYHPRLPMAVSGSYDGTFKVWVRSSVDSVRSISRAGEVDEAQYVWTCRSVGSYKDFPVRGVAFSEDGSLLAVAYGHLVTLWDPVECALKSILPQPQPHEQIQAMTFGGSTNYLAVATENHLYVWDLVECKVWWSYEVRITSLVSTNHHNGEGLSYIAVVVEESASVGGYTSAVVLFDVRSPTPLRVWKSQSKGAVVGLAFEKRGSSASKDREIVPSLVLFTNDGDFQRLADAEEREELKVESVPGSSKTVSKRLDRSPRSVFEQAFVAADVTNSELMSEQKAVLNEGVFERAQVSDQAISELLDTPVHVLPQSGTLFPCLMQSLVGRRAEDRDREIREESLAAECEATVKLASDVRGRRGRKRKWLSVSRERASSEEEQGSMASFFLKLMTETTFDVDDGEAETAVEPHMEPSPEQKVAPTTPKRLASARKTGTFVSKTPKASTPRRRSARKKLASAAKASA